MSPYVAVLLVQVLFGLLPTAGAAAMQTLSPPALIGLRTLAAAPLLFVLARALTGGVAVPRREVPRLFGLAVLGVTINQLLFAEGVRRAGPVHAIVLVVCIPAMTLAVAVLLGRERLSRRRGLGMALALVGALGVVGGERFSLDSERFVGDLCLLANALSYAIYLVLVRPVVERVPGLVVVAWVFLFGALAALPWTAPAIAAAPLASLTPGIWATLAFIVLGPTCGSYALNAIALRRLDASLVALFIALQPLIGAVAAWALLDAEVTTRTVVSGVVLTSGVLFASWVPRARPPAPA
jgi:drug/metabolite transporter (DMT)-like permease